MMENNMETREERGPYKGEQSRCQNQIPVYVNDKQLEELNQWAKETGQSRSAVIRDIITDALDARFPKRQSKYPETNVTRAVPGIPDPVDNP